MILTNPAGQLLFQNLECSFVFSNSHDLNHFVQKCKKTTSSVVVSNFTAAASPASNSVCHIHVVKRCRETQELDVVVEALPNFNGTK